MNPFRRILSMSILTAALAPTFMAHAAEFEARTVKFPSASNKGHPQVQVVEKFAELMAKKTNGKFKVQASRVAHWGLTCKRYPPCKAARLR